MALRPSKQLEDPKSGSLHEVSQFTGGCKQGANFVLLMVFLKVYSFLPAWSIIKHCSTGVCHEKSKNVVDMGPFQRTSEHFINHLDTFLSVLWNWFFFKHSLTLVCFFDSLSFFPIFSKTVFCSQMLFPYHCSRGWARGSSLSICFLISRYEPWTQTNTEMCDTAVSGHF